MKTKLDIWLDRAKTCDAHEDPLVMNVYMTEAIEIIIVLKNSLEWIVPKIHQAYHDGEEPVCQKGTCDVYHDALALDPDKL
jgi:hypothetical protein